MNNEIEIIGDSIEQIEIGEQATNYSEHEGGNLEFPLQEGQKMLENDYLSGNGIHHRKKQIELDGTESWVLELEKEGYSTFKLNLTEEIKNVGNETKLDILSNYFKRKDVHSSEEEGVFHIGDSIYISYTTKTLDAFKAFLASKKTEGKPVVVEYEREEEIVEEYNQEQDDAYNKLQEVKAYKPITNIYTEEAKMSVSYIADTKTYIDNRIEALSEVL